MEQVNLAVGLKSDTIEGFESDEIEEVQSHKTKKEKVYIRVTE